MNKNHLIAKYCYFYYTKNSISVNFLVGLIMKNLKLLIIISITTPVCFNASLEKFKDYDSKTNKAIQSKILQELNDKVLYPFDIETIESLINNEANDQHLLDELLVKASFHNKAEVCRLLLEKGANPNYEYRYSNGTSKTPLTIAQEKNYIGVVSVLKNRSN